MSFERQLTALAGAVLAAARARGWHLVTAESCTGGLIAAALTEVAGASDVFERGYVTYSNAAKQADLGVSADTLERFGAVSEGVAREMAAGALAASGADLTLSVTGIAGPGGSNTKPEGQVCFGIASRQGVRSETMFFDAIGRAHVRTAATHHGLTLLLDACRTGAP